MAALVFGIADAAFDGRTNTGKPPKGYKAPPHNLMRSPNNAQNPIMQSNTHNARQMARTPPQVAMMSESASPQRGPQQIPRKRLARKRRQDKLCQPGGCCGYKGGALAKQYVLYATIFILICVGVGAGLTLARKNKNEALDTYNEAVTQWDASEFQAFDNLVGNFVLRWDNRTREVVLTEDRAPDRVTGNSKLVTYTNDKSYYGVYVPNCPQACPSRSSTFNSGDVELISLSRSTSHRGGQVQGPTPTPTPGPAGPNMPAPQPGFSPSPPSPPPSQSTPSPPAPMSYPSVSPRSPPVRPTAPNRPSTNPSPRPTPGVVAPSAAPNNWPQPYSPSTPSAYPSPPSRFSSPPSRSNNGLGFPRALFEKTIEINVTSTRCPDGAQTPRPVNGVCQVQGHLIAVCVVVQVSGGKAYGSSELPCWEENGIGVNALYSADAPLYGPIRVEVRSLNDPYLVALVQGLSKFEKSSGIGGQALAGIVVLLAGIACLFPCGCCYYWYFADTAVEDIPQQEIEMMRRKMHQNSGGFDAVDATMMGGSMYAMRGGGMDDMDVSSSDEDKSGYLDGIDVDIGDTVDIGLGDFFTLIGDAVGSVDVLGALDAFDGDE